MPNKLIVLMVDGVSAEHYETERRQFPHFMALEQRGFRVKNLHAAVLGTSLPGRASMMTGETADISGIYGNRIWDGKQFRYANPDDVCVPTLPARARAAGKTVAVVGFGMIRPEDADIFVTPWWIGSFIQRGRDAEPEPADHSWLRVADQKPGDYFERVCAEAGVPATLPVLDMSNEANRPFYGIVADHAMAEWVGVLAASDDAPDLIVAESLSTDTIQHKTGYKSPLAQWSVAQADLAVGRILQRLRAAGVEDQWNIAVMSDHGHSPIETALHPQVIIPGVTVQCEGVSLLVAPKDAEELAFVTARLAEYGVDPYPATCIPAKMREQLFIFVAPPLVSFENDDPAETEPTGKPSATSSHGLRPGLAGDDRFALFAGPDVPQGAAEQADAVQVAPTLAMLLNLPEGSFPAAPIFTRS